MTMVQSQGGATMMGQWYNYDEAMLYHAIVIVPAISSFFSNVQALIIIYKQIYFNLC